jgi:DNA adenine methylase
MQAKRGSVVYCDPPYVPLNNSANFTQYRSGGFSLVEQQTLATLAKKLSRKGIPVLVSNHSNAFTHQLYEGAAIEEFSVQRYISCKVENRSKVLELLALY